MFESLLNREFLDNTVFRYLICLGVIMLGSVLIFIFNHIIIKKQKAIQSAFSKITGNSHEIELQKFIRPFLHVILFYGSLKTILKLPERINNVIHILFIITVTYYGIQLVSAIVKNSLTTYLKRRDKDINKVEQRVKGISTFNSIIIWTIGIIFLISNTGFNITAVITGLGIGGVALALASQNIFMDMFNYFVIFFDQPFQIGDFIVMDDLMGTVEKIGIKTTRIRSLEGEEVIISNTDLTSKHIHNYKKLEKRRVIFSIGVVYGTSHDHLEAIPSIIKVIIDNIESAAFDRVHFKSYGDSGLIFEIVYFILSPDYNQYMDIQQKINLNIYKEFEARNIEFAFPTRTIFIKNHEIKTNGTN